MTNKARCRHHYDLSQRGGGTTHLSTVWHQWTFLHLTLHLAIADLMEAEYMLLHQLGHLIWCICYLSTYYCQWQCFLQIKSRVWIFVVNRLGGLSWNSCLNFLSRKRLLELCPCIGAVSVSISVSFDHSFVHSGHAFPLKQIVACQHLQHALWRYQWMEAVSVEAPACLEDKPFLWH